jgi:hypothetical protein
MESDWRNGCRVRPDIILIGEEKSIKETSSSATEGPGDLYHHGCGNRETFKCDAGLKKSCALSLGYAIYIASM